MKLIWIKADHVWYSSAESIDSLNDSSNDLRRCSRPQVTLLAYRMKAGMTASTLAVETVLI